MICSCILLLLVYTDIVERRDMRPEMTFSGSSGNGSNSSACSLASSCCLASLLMALMSRFVCGHLITTSRKWLVRPWTCWALRSWACRDSILCSNADICAHVSWPCVSRVVFANSCPRASTCSRVSRSLSIACSLMMTRLRTTWWSEGMTRQ